VSDRCPLCSQECSVEIVDRARTHVVTCTTCPVYEMTSQFAQLEAPNLTAGAKTVLLKEVAAVARSGRRLCLSTDYVRWAEGFATEP